MRFTVVWMPAALDDLMRIFRDQMKTTAGAAEASGG
jgi:hypothetical protein